MENRDYFNNLGRDTLTSILKSLQANIFFKDLDLNYVFVSNSKDIKNDVIGKNSLEANENKEDGKLSYETDKRIIETGKGLSYTRTLEINGITKYIKIIKNPVFDKNNKVIGISGLVIDITDDTLKIKKLNDLANKDSLTGVYNRTYVNYWLNTWNKEDIYPLTLFSVDCNDLKYINDLNGHVAGDQYLKNTATILSLNALKDSIVARMGGDEFLVISPNCDEEKAKAYIKLVREKAEPIRVSNSPLSFAIGYNTVKYYTENLESNIKQADVEMYTNKSLMKKKGALRK